MNRPMEDGTVISMGIQDNAKFTAVNTPWMDGWLSARASLNTHRFKANFEKIDKVSVILRVGGEMGDFGGVYGFERRRFIARSKYITCDFVVQADAVLADKVLFSKEQAQADLRNAFEHLMEHHTMQSNPLGCELLRAKVKSAIAS